MGKSKLLIGTVAAAVVAGAAALYANAGAEAAPASTFLLLDGSKRTTYDVLLRRIPVAKAKKKLSDGVAPLKDHKIPGGTAR